MSPSLAPELTRWLAAAAVVWAIHGPPVTSAGQAPAPVDAYTDTQAFLRVVYPDLAQPRRYVIWFETFRASMESVASSRDSFMVFVAPRTVVPDKPDDPGVRAEPVLRAIVRVGRDGRLSWLSTSGSALTNWPRSEAVLALAGQHRPSTDEQFQRIMQSAGAQFLPGMKNALLERAGPVIAESNDGSVS